MNGATFAVTIAWSLAASAITSSETAPNPQARSTAGADRHRTLPAFNVGDGEGFEQELERTLNRELDSMADELLTLLELDQAPAMVAFPVDHNAGSKGTSTFAPAEDQDQELIAALLEKLEFSRASADNPTKVYLEPPREAETGEEKERKFGSSYSGITDVRGSNRNKRRHETSRRITQSRRGHKPRTERRSRRVDGSTVHHQQQQRRGIAKRSSSTRCFSASDRTENGSAAAPAALRRPLHRSEPSTATRDDPGSHRAAARATDSGPQSPAPTTGIGGCGRCCRVAAAGPRVSGAEGTESPPRRGSCKGLAFSVLRRSAQGMLVTAAVLAPLSIIVAGPESRWPLVLLFVPLVHAFVAWVGFAVRVSDRATIDRVLGVVKVGVVVLLCAAVYGIVMAVTQPLSRFKERPIPLLTL